MILRCSGYWYQRTSNLYSSYCADRFGNTASGTKLVSDTVPVPVPISWVALAAAYEYTGGGDI